MFQSFLRLRKTWTSLAIAAVLASALGIPSQQVNAEGPSDLAPSITPAAANGKKVLFDNTHAQTAGAADWVIDGGFSDFANGLAAEGYYVKELRKSTTITLSDLSGYDVFVIPEANIPYKTSEQTALLNYVQGGGSIFFISDHYNADRNKNRWDASEVFNGYRRGAWANPALGMSTEEAASSAMSGVASADWLSSNFGVRFRYNALGDVTANNIVTPSQAFNITSGVSTVAVHAGSTLAITDPAKAKGIVYVPTTAAAWPSAVDAGVYNGGGVAEGPFVAVAKVSAGKAGFIGDSSPVEDASPKYKKEETGGTKTTYNGYGEANDATLLINMVNWLATPESYTTLSSVPGLTLDTATPLYSWEAPASSTEPVTEPWASPAAGYKWYDPSTFKVGSYGASSTSTTTPTYAFNHQATLPNHYEFQVEVIVTGLTANSTTSGYSLGVYTSTGTQVAKVKNSDGSWPSSYGYSSTFSLTANSSGVASKILTVTINPSVTGAANMRLRLSGTAKYTEAVTIADVPVQ
ncbi:DNA-binding protein [Paenibacillus durus]|uniref:DNA-binding protein n=1 Tax=Paenibacillus durus ATCC 35681 TaxID=1333534 RepID=A0A0F7CIT3_PAEDU|nr:DNA-binding protein [Paenibacillus durus]AKG34885.1 DNA-binding protein [Paenibacillus durus ATCC 35681]